MKKCLVVSLLFSLLLVGGAAFATEGGISFDLSPSYATEPIGPFGGGWGIDLGANADFARLGINVNLPQNMRLQGRASVGYYEWTKDYIFGDSLEYTRYPFDVGGRFVYSINPQFKAHGDLAIEISRDKFEVSVAPGVKSSTSEWNIGAVPGVGITYYVNDQFYVGADARYHALSDDYFTLGATFGFNIP